MLEELHTQCSVQHFRAYCHAGPIGDAVFLLLAWLGGNMSHRLASDISTPALWQVSESCGSWFTTIRWFITELVVALSCQQPGALLQHSD